MKQEMYTYTLVHTITRYRHSPDLPEAADTDSMTFLQDGHVDKNAAGFNRHFLNPPSTHSLSVQSNSAYCKDKHI